MKSFFKFTLRVMVCLLFFLPLNSCEQIADEIFECIINRGPELSLKILDGGAVGVMYSEYVRAAIQNEPNDDEYDYYFDFSGNLPPGLEIIVDYRKVIFEGIPTEAGRYDITVHVSVDGPEYYDEETDSWDDDLCFYSHSATYTIRILNEK